MSTEKIKRVDCTLNGAWYKDHVGEEFGVRSSDKDVYWVREPAVYGIGHINIVKKEDAIVI